MIFLSHVRGIPCQVEIISISDYDPGVSSGPPERCYEPEGGEAEFQLRDRKGYLAPWLEKLMTPVDQDRIEEEAFERYNDSKHREHDEKVFDYD